MQTANSGASSTAGLPQAIGGLLAAIVGGFFVAQAGGSDRETFLFIGFMFGALGFLGMLVGGVAIGIRLTRT